METIKKQWLPRGLVGALAGLLLAALCRDALFQGGFSMPALCEPLIEQVGMAWAVIITCVLFFGLGAAAGIAAIPFADSGRELVLQSLVHFAVTAALWSLLLGVSVGAREPAAWLLWLGSLILVYAVVWLGRWVGWFAEVAAIRAKLGLAPGPSLFHWRESLPYVGFAFLLCLVIPMALRIFDAPDVPVLSVMYAWLLLPVGGFMSGLSLGRRHGFCPLYPAACTAFILLFITLARLVSNMADGGLIPLALITVLAGNLAGAARHKMKQKARDTR